MNKIADTDFYNWVLSNAQLFREGKKTNAKLVGGMDERMERIQLG